MNENMMMKEHLMLNVKPEKYYRILSKKNYAELLKLYVEAVFRKISDNYKVQIEFADDIKYLIEDYIENFYQKQEK
jgi:hypothetical protein